MVFIADTQGVHVLRQQTESTYAAASAAAPASPFSSPRHLGVTLDSLPLTHIPASSEVIALDSFHSSEDGRIILVVVLGIRMPTNSNANAASTSTPIPATSNATNTINNNAQGQNQTKNTIPTNVGVPNRFILNIYGLSSRPSPQDLTFLSNDCVSFRIGFIPFHLSHSFLLPGCNSFGPPDLLLTGGDRQVHIWRYQYGAYAELPSGPEHPLADIAHTPAAVLAIEVARTEKPHRVFVAAGCQDGLVRFGCVSDSSPIAHDEYADDTDSTNSSVLISSRFARFTDVHLDGPVTSIQLFSPSTHTNRQVWRDRPMEQHETTHTEDTTQHQLERIQQRALEAYNEHHTSHPLDLRLLMANTVGFGAVYR